MWLLSLNNQVVRFLHSTFLFVFRRYVPNNCAHLLIRPLLWLRDHAHSPVIFEEVSNVVHCNNRSGRSWNNNNGSTRTDIWGGRGEREGEREKEGGRERERGREGEKEGGRERKRERGEIEREREKEGGGKGGRIIFSYITPV